MKKCSFKISTDFSLQFAAVNRDNVKDVVSVQRVVRAIKYVTLHLSNHSVYLQNSAKGLYVCLPLTFCTAGNVLTVSFIANNSKHDARSREQNSVLAYRMS